MSAFDVGNNSIQRRIVREFFATTGLVLVLSSGALFVTASIQFQNITDKNLIAIARVIGGNTEASLRFNDEQAAMETLRALKAEESLEAAIVYDSDGLVFAKYIRADIVDFRPPRELPFFPQWSRRHIDLASQIRLADEDLGTVFLRQDTKQATQFFYTSIAIVLSVLLISLFLSWFGASRLRRHIADPLERLVEGSAAMAGGDLST